MKAFRSTNIFGDVEDPLVQAFEMLKQREQENEVNIFEAIFNPVYGKPTRNDYADTQD